MGGVAEGKRNENEQHKVYRESRVGWEAVYERSEEGQIEEVKKRKKT